MSVHEVMTLIGENCYVRNNGPYLGPNASEPQRMFEIAIRTRNGMRTFIYARPRRFTTTESFREVPSEHPGLYVEELPSAQWFDSLEEYLTAAGYSAEEREDIFRQFPMGEG